MIMFNMIVFVVQVLSVVSAITVPPFWPKEIQNIYVSGESSAQEPQHNLNTNLQTPSFTHIKPTTSDFKPRPNFPPKQASSGSKYRSGPEVPAPNKLILSPHLEQSSHEEFKLSLIPKHPLPPHQAQPELNPALETRTGKIKSSLGTSHAIKKQNLTSPNPSNPVSTYKPSNNQVLFIYHPGISKAKGIEVPQSYQIVKLNDKINKPILNHAGLGLLQHKPQEHNLQQHKPQEKVEGPPIHRPSNRSRNKNGKNWRLEGRRFEEPARRPPEPELHRYKNEHLENTQRFEEPGEDNLEQEHDEEDHEEVNEDNDESEEDGEDGDESEEETSISEHKLPKDAPTRPYYPGVGQWAKFGLKHKPYTVPSSSRNNIHYPGASAIPEGHEIFEGGLEQFQQSQKNYENDLKTFPARHQIQKSKIDESESESESEPLYEKPELGFVPQKLYAQVRRTESKSHHPRSELDPQQEENAARLREVIKDSKIHTVYTEEGYEDSAYDHAGHEKEAENSEGHAHITEDRAGTSGKSRGGNRDKYEEIDGKKRGSNNVIRKYKDDEKHLRKIYNETERFQSENHDSQSSGSNTLPSKKIQTVTLKNKDTGVDMEIHTEVKYTAGPDKKKHKFVKIIPSIKEDKMEPVHRVKRYNQEKLAKLYVRKHPNYYWKKKSTNTRHKYIHSTTVRPDINLRLRFETAFNRQSSIATNEDLIKPRVISTSTSTTTTPAPTTSTTTKTTTTTTATSKPTKAYPPKLFTAKIRKLKRSKRYTIDHLGVSMDLKEFVDVGKLTLPTKKSDLTNQKYPYYKLPQVNLNPNSPLRYAEDMANIPPKTNNKMAFYDSREHIKCTEIESYVNPIPERVQNEEESEETNQEANEQSRPRLQGLGDKIDCFKVKYFGENPLDSPFFNEKVIAGPVPFFAVNKQKTFQENYSKQNQKPSERNPNKRDIKLKFLEPIVVVDDLFEAATVNPIHKSTEAVLKPPYTLFQMMNMLKSQPRNIYDQISRQKSSKNIHDPSNDFIIIYENPNTIKTVTDDNKHPLEYKIGEINLSHHKYDTPKVSDIISDLTTLSHNIPKPEAINIVPPNITEIDLLYPMPTTEVLIGHYSEDSTVTTSKPEVYTYKSRRNIQKRPENNLRKLPSKKILKPGYKNTRKINKALEPTVPTNLLKATGIVDEFDSIEESLNDESNKLKVKVFKTTNRLSTSVVPTSVEPLRMEVESSAELEQTQRLYVEPSAEPDLSIFSRRISPFVVFDINKFIPRNANHKIITSEVQYKEEIKPSDQMKMYNDVLKTINVTRNEVGDESKKIERPINYAQHMSPVKETITSNTNSSTIQISNEENNQQASESIIRLVPPSKNYRTIFSPIYENEDAQVVQATKNRNRYYVLGMKPPLSKSRKPQHKLYKRSTKHQSKPDEIEDMLMEESHLVEHYLKRIKRHMLKDDLVTAESNYDIARKPKIYSEINRRLPKERLITAETSYEVTPSRKPKVYTEIVRQRTNKPEISDSDVEEDIDLNPRKRVYQLMSRTTSTAKKLPAPELEYEDILEEIVPEIEEPTTTSEPVIYPVEAHKENPAIAEYLFLIEKLHEKWEKEMPSTTEAPSTTTQKPEIVITQSVAESVNVRRGEPAYLQIINQLHELRTETEDKTTTVSSVEATTVDTQTFPIKNSNPFILASIMPDSFMSELNFMQSKLENSEDTSERIRNLNSHLKTTIDTSRYKTIERPISTRHNFSSRFSADDELPLRQGQTSQIHQVKDSASDHLEVFPLVSRSSKTPIEIQINVTTEENLSVEMITEMMDTTTNNDLNSTNSDLKTNLNQTSSRLDPKLPKPEPIVPIPETSTVTPDSRSRSRNRFRSRPTTTSTSKTASSVISITPSPMFRRRRPTKPTTTITTTTTTTPNSIKPDIIPRRRSRLRTHTEVPTNHKTTFTPIDESSINTEDMKKPRKLQRIHERRVMSEVTLTRFYDPESDSEEDESLEESKRHQYEVIGPLLHADTGHGGNYKHSSTTDATMKTDDFYSGSSTTAKSRSSNVLIQEEIEETITQKPIHTKVSLLPNMARMVNRLAEPPMTNEESDEVEEYKPAFIKDPSRRMYYYAKL